MSKLLKSKYKYLACFIIGLFLCLFFNQNSCYAALSQSGLDEQQRSMFSANGIKFYNFHFGASFDP